MTLLHFEAFFNEHFHKAVYNAQKIVTHKEIAEDIVQEVFIKMLPKFSGKINDPVRYLYTSVRNASIDFAREKFKKIKATGQFTEKIEFNLKELSDEEAEYSENLRKLFLEIERLPAPAKEVVRLICFERYSYRRAADELNIPLATVKTHMFRAMRFLRKNMSFLFI